MKKIIALLLALSLVLALCACGEEAVEPTATPAPTEAPTPTPVPTPLWESGYARTSTVGVEYSRLSRGDEVNVIGAEGDYYRVETGDMTVFVEKCFIRLDVEEGFTPFTGYGAEDGCEVYYNPYMSSAAISSFDMGETVNVIDRFGVWMLVEIDGIEGCTLAKNITEEEPKKKTYSSGGYSSGGSGNDGGDISLGFAGEGAGFVKLASYGEENMYVPFPEGHGVVLANGVEAYLFILHKGDSYMVINDVGRERTVYDGENTGTVPGWTLNMSKDSVYTAWDGYAVENAEAYDNYRTIGNPTLIEINTPVHVVYDIGTCYLVTVNGVEYFMPYDTVSTTEMEKPVTHKGSGSGGSGGGGGSSAEWSEPVL